MTVLTNKIELCARTNNDTGLIDIPIGSSIEYINKKTGYHAYYEINTYSLFCRYKEKDIIISCSKYVGGNEPKVDCIKGNLHSNKKHYWSETFNETFPECF
jgi:hypothetical protein